jgi:uncharacterized small protein (DUF1192 family)
MERDTVVIVSDKAIDCCTETRHKEFDKIGAEALCDVLDNPYVSELESKIAILQAENAELRKDKERLDWSEEFRPDIFYEVTYPETKNEAKGPGFFVCFGAGGWVEEKTLRQSIDAAVEAAK